MFSIKICGITRPEDAMAAAVAGADAIGLNFYSGSPRVVSVEQAAEIANVLPDSVARVGVFVNETAEMIHKVASAVGLDWVQLHGDEAPEFSATLPTDRCIIMAYRVHGGDFGPLVAHLKASSQAGRSPDALLLDAFSTKEYGGTGKTLPWELLRDLPSEIEAMPIVLAGGLTPINVAEAIAAAGPACIAVDTASGVESAPGIKNTEDVRKFVAAAKETFLKSRGIDGK